MTGKSRRAGLVTHGIPTPPLLGGGGSKKRHELTPPVPALRGGEQNGIDLQPWFPVKILNQRKAREHQLKGFFAEPPDTFEEMDTQELLRGRCSKKLSPGHRRPGFLRGLFAPCPGVRGRRAPGSLVRRPRICDEIFRAQGNLEEGRKRAGGLFVPSGTQQVIKEYRSEHPLMDP